MVLSEIILVSFILVAAIALIVITVSYISYRVKGKKKVRRNLRSTIAEITSGGHYMVNQVTNSQYNDNNNYYDVNYSYNQNNLIANETDIAPKYPSLNNKTNKPFYDTNINRKNYSGNDSNNRFVKKVTYK